MKQGSARTQRDVALVVGESSTRGKLWGYGYEALAALLGTTVPALKNAISRGTLPFDPADLASVFRYWRAQQEGVDLIEERAAGRIIETVEARIRALCPPSYREKETFPGRARETAPTSDRVASVRAAIEYAKSSSPEEPPEVPEVPEAPEEIPEEREAAGTTRSLEGPVEKGTFLVQGDPIEDFEAEWQALIEKADAWIALTIENSYSPYVPDPRLKKIIEVRAEESGKLQRLREINA